ncbi:hypothetical protein [Nocardioides sp. Root190]|uniref:hypothetical protein n=1 Tax=Nocardioides sp. Root190 TaxID=1736488 RepID=UPI0012F73CFC|nr:hypothetical protein [Nocardioides sp. Root190]
MFGPETSREHLEQALSLPPWDSQDWGICQADEERLPDFVAFFHQHYSGAWPRWIVEEYIDLVLESACDARRSDSAYDLGVLDGLLAIVASRAPDRIRYWTSADWEVAPYLRAKAL